MSSALRLLPDEKRCSKCREMLPASEFSPSIATASGLASRCRDCHRRHARTVYDPLKARLWHLRDKYGITPEQYHAMLEAQGGVCAICRQPQDIIYTGRGGNALAPLHVDHNHATGDVRALLCNGCNGAVGSVKENPAIAEAVAAYLRKHRVP